MVKIRLKRMGAKKRPFYRIVVADSRNPRDGKSIEEIGYYNPLIDPPEVKFNTDRFDYWVSQGAKPTKTVEKIHVHFLEDNKNNPEESVETEEENTEFEDRAEEEATEAVTDDVGVSADDAEDLAFNAEEVADSLVESEE